MTAQEALAGIAGAFADTRIHYCRLEIGERAPGRYALTGEVLNRSTLARVLDGLAAELPGRNVDVAEVRILEERARRLCVGVNLTGLFAQPSWLAEQISQLLNGWPLDILLEQDRWAFARQADGYLGWAYLPYLTAPDGCAFTHLVCEPEVRLLSEPRPGCPPATRIPGGTAVAVDGSAGEWRHLALAGGHAGWAPASALRAFSALPDHPAARRAQMMVDASAFVGAPYLWGGCSAWGIDCSGYAQLLHRLVGVTLPRDADMQFDAGRPVEYPYQPGDLLFFSETGDPRKITHVAVSRGGWDIIHSSRRINGVYEDNVQAVEGLRESFIAGRTFVE